MTRFYQIRIVFAKNDIFIIGIGLASLNTVADPNQVIQRDSSERGTRQYEQRNIFSNTRHGL